MSRDDSKDRQRSRELVSKMTTGEKIVYYLDTYKIHIICTVVFVFGAVMLLRSLLSYREPLMYIGMINSTNVDYNYLQGGVEEAIGDTSGRRVTFYRDLGAGVENYDGTYSMLTVYIVSKELTVAFTDETGLNFLRNQTLGTDVNTWISDDLRALWADRIKEVPVALEAFDPNEIPADQIEYRSVPAVIDISGTKVHERLLLDEDIRYLVSVYTEGYEEALAGFCKFLTGIENEN